MFKNNFEFKKEESKAEILPVEREEVFEDFNKRESAIQKEAEGFLMSLVPEKFKKEAVGLLAAFSIFTASSSAFAEGFKVEEIDKGELLPENQIEETAIEKLSSQELFGKMIGSGKKDELAPFDWKKIADKVEISVGVEFGKISEVKSEAIRASDYDSLVDSDFYKDLSYKEFSNAINTELNSVLRSKNSQEFFATLSMEKENLNDVQKALILQYLGKALGETYNYDMLEQNQYVEVSDEAMFSALKELLETGKIIESGICGNIHTFLTKTAESLGVEAWLQSGLQGGGSSLQGPSQHIWFGMVVEAKGKKQIVFLNYDDLIPTGTLNYQDAKGIYEKYSKAVDALNSFVGDEQKVLLSVDSRAQEVTKKAAGFEKTEERLETELAEGKIKKENGLEITLNPEVKEIKLTKNTFALAYFDYQDVNNNPYQSLEHLNALRSRLNFKGERFGLEADATVLHMTIKDLYDSSVVQNDIITRLAADYIDSHKFTKSEYGQFVLNFGATLQAGLRMPLDKKIEMSTVGAMGEGGAGVRLIYVNPAETGKFYIGNQEIFRAQTNDFQNQDLIIKEIAKTLIVGAEVKVNEVQIMNLEVAGSELDWGKKMEVKGGIAGKEWKGELGYGKATSEYERFVPSSEKVSAEIGYKSGPKWEVDVIGSKTTEKYKDAEGEDIYNAEVKLKIFLW